jgi:tight adherence protein C
MLLILGFALCASGVLLALETVLRPRTGRRVSLRRAVTYATATAAPRTAANDKPSFAETIVPPLSRIARRLTPPKQLEQLELRLAAAGLSPRLNVQQWLAVKTILGVLVILLGLASGGLTGRGLLLVVVLVGAALIVPDFVLARAGRSRAERLTAALPQAIDQLVVSLEAGLGFDAAVSYFVRRGRSPLAAELRVMLSQIRMGEARTEALKRLAERIPSDDMRKFVQILVQSEGVGMSRAAILSSQAADLRHRRQLAAEEKAQKAPITMLFPVVVFILPVMFVFILGPAFQQASRLFGH